MASVEDQVRSASAAIDANLAALAGDRGLLSQNLLQHLRGLVEGLLVWIHLGAPSRSFDYAQVGPARTALKGRAEYRILTRFHALLQISTSHYSLAGDLSERLMLKYYEYLLPTRELAARRLRISIVENLELFPTQEDPALRDYYHQIARRIGEVTSDPSTDQRGRYYIRNTRPFFVNGRTCYEVTFTRAHDRASKSDRVIGFTDIDIAENYAAQLELSPATITVAGRRMPILIIRDWSVSVRPCEFDNFARLLDMPTGVSAGHAEYRNLMRYLTTTAQTLLDLMDAPDSEYQGVRRWATGATHHVPLIFPALDRARALIRADLPGARLLRYLMLRMNNQVLKLQFAAEKCQPLSDLRVSPGCRPFDTMPLCTSPRGHNPRFRDLAESIDASSRTHELLARRVRNNVEQRGVLYTPESELEQFGDLDTLIETYNQLLPPSSQHASRKLRRANGHVFIVGYEDDTVAIIERLQQVASCGAPNYAQQVRPWLKQNAALADSDPRKVDDDRKVAALRSLFEHSKVAVVYGAAGTGKSRMVNHIANYFDAESKLFLAHTNPAVANLRRLVDAHDATFSTIASHLNGPKRHSRHYGLVVVDECSTVSNTSILQVLTRTSFDLLVLVGDVYQIESIEFGNWFDTIRSYLPPESIFELTQPFRTTDESLRTLWRRVRGLDERIEESLAKSGYSKLLGDLQFEHRVDDEIVLCLTYDGLYGINQVNRLLQLGNPSPAVAWSGAVYKVGDPVLFNEGDRFRPLIFNNLKGRITRIVAVPGRITFDVDIERELSASEADESGLRAVGRSVVQFDVFEQADSDSDDDAVNTIVPFQVAYAVSIHKAQGLEYDSLKLVIPDVNEHKISHNIFYTAITRAREQLTLYWTPLTQKRILERLEVRENRKNEQMLKVRRGVQPVLERPRRGKVRPLP